jgi:hypothetical protein
MNFSLSPKGPENRSLFSGPPGHPEQHVIRPWSKCTSHTAAPDSQDRWASSRPTLPKSSPTRCCGGQSVPLRRLASEGSTVPHIGRPHPCTSAWMLAPLALESVSASPLLRQGPSVSLSCVCWPGRDLQRPCRGPPGGGQAFRGQSGWSGHLLAPRSLEWRKGPDLVGIEQVVGGTGPRYALAPSPEPARRAKC